LHKSIPREFNMKKIVALFLLSLTPLATPAVMMSSHVRRGTAVA